MSVSRCRAEARAAVEQAKRDCRADLVVATAATVRPARSPTGTWAVEVLAEPEAGGAPPVVLDTLTDYGLTVRRVHRGGDCWRVLATT